MTSSNKKPRAIKTPATRTKPPSMAKPVSTPKAEPKVAAAPKQSQTNPHVDAGIRTDRYAGTSSFVNGNRKVKILLGREVPPSRLTGRAQAGFYALRELYKDNVFQPRGFDNGILRDLAGAGLISLTGGQEASIDGNTYKVDGAQPVKIKITAAGQSYGKA